MDIDETYFAYSFPYTFTRISRLIKLFKEDKKLNNHLKDSTPLCKSLSGVEVPYLIVTSRANSENYH